MRWFSYKQFKKRAARLRKAKAQIISNLKTKLAFQGNQVTIAYSKNLTGVTLQKARRTKNSLVLVSIIQGANGEARWAVTTQGVVKTPRTVWVKTQILAKSPFWKWRRRRWIIFFNSNQFSLNPISWDNLKYHMIQMPCKRKGSKLVSLKSSLWVLT